MKISIIVLFGILLFPLTTYGQSVKVQKNIEYSSAGHRMDLCKPSGKTRKTAIIFIHGGGFSTGNKSQMLGYCKLLAKGGFTSVTINYSLTSQGHAYPMALNDTQTAVRWMRDNSKRLGFDPNKIVLIGYSAGATLALSAGLADRSYVAGIVDVAGISNFESAREKTPFQRLRQDIDAYVGNSQLSAVSPINQVSRNDPPVSIFHGKNDNLVSVRQSIDLAKKLDANGVRYLLRVFEDVGHEVMLPNKHLKQLLEEVTKFLLAIDAS